MGDDPLRISVSNGVKLIKNHRLKSSKLRVELLGADAARLAPDRPMVPPCSGPSRRGLEPPEVALLAECRPAVDWPLRTAA
jgi:hypothetical protein